jgi:dynamin 1-like protein
VLAFALALEICTALKSLHGLPLRCDPLQRTGCGIERKVSPFSLQIHSPDVPDLTVVDLPGTTTIPMKNQPASIVDDLQNMVLHYISDPNSIILAVTPANADVANSQALQLATRVDPSHNRTIGVLTKIDLMDRGTNAVDILNNRKYPLKLGWVGVVNRSQQDIEGRKTLAEAKQAEIEYFHGRPDSPYRCALVLSAKKALRYWPFF